MSPLVYLVRSIGSLGRWLAGQGRNILVDLVNEGLVR